MNNLKLTINFKNTVDSSCLLFELQISNDQSSSNKFNFRLRIQKTKNNKVSVKTVTFIMKLSFMFKG